MRSERYENVKKIFEKNGPILKSSILRENKIGSREIAELVSDGHINRIKNGYYIWNSDVNNVEDMEIAVSVIKNGVLCLFSAAQLYGLTTVNPMAIDIAVPCVGKVPVLPKYPPINIYRVTQSIFNIGISEIRTASTMLRVYNKERVVCDFFRFRIQIGEDIALEVFKSYISGRDVNIQRLLEYADKLRIKSVMKPYVEALL